jgi:hypothetical protein
MADTDMIVAAEVQMAMEPEVIAGQDKVDVVMNLALETVGEA